MKVLIAGNVYGELSQLKSIVDALFAKGNKFDLLLCCGVTLSTNLSLPAEPFPCKSAFVDSSEVSALLMNQSALNNTEIAKNFNWLGRSGISIMNGVRVAFLSGIDSDILGAEIVNADNDQTYLGNYFVKKDVDKLINQFR